MSIRRQQLIRDAASFLVAGGMRPRAVVISGESGIGKTTFLDKLQVEILAAGRTNVITLDDAHLANDAEIAAIGERLASDARSCVLVACESLPAALARIIDSVCERRIIEVPALEDEAARELLAGLGVQPWSMLALQIIASGGGNPRTVVDRAFDSVDLDRLPVVDSSLDGEAWSASAARRLELAHGYDADAMERFVDAAKRLVEQDDADEAARAEAHGLLAEVALRQSELEVAIQHGELAGTADSASDAVRILASAAASAARALRGEPTAMLSLHALAGRASRSGLPVVEASLWQQIAWCACILGDVATSRRAAIRSVELSDAHGAVLMSLRARLMLADLHLAANEPGAARHYLEEIADVAGHRGHVKLRIDAMAGSINALTSLGMHDDACRIADEAIEAVLRADATRFDAVFVSVNAARAYAASGSTSLALAPIEALASELGDSNSPDFWLVLEAVRVLGRAGTDPAAFQRWTVLFTEFDADGHGGALRAAHAEVDAWRVAVDGRRAEAARLAQRARQLWITAECHDEVALTDVLIQQAPIEHGPRISLVGSSAVTTEPAADPEAFEVLTKREREIARYVAGGLTNPEIASELHLSPRTVEHHVASILRKLELPSRRALVRGRV